MRRWIIWVGAALGLIALVSIVYQLYVMYGYNVYDPTRISKGRVAQVVTPDSQDELREAIQNASGPIAIAGAKYSQGGQTWIHDGTVVDIKNLNRIIDVDIPNATMTVESGCTWRQILEMLTPMGLSPEVMQSYYDFTVGGALSVNAHGRDTTGSIIKTVRSIRVMLYDGSIVNADRSERYDLFCAMIGGYSSCGIITEATLSLVDNTMITRETVSMPSHKYISYLHDTVIPHEYISLHNCIVYPPDFRNALVVNWHENHPQQVVRIADISRYTSPHVIDTFGELILRRIWGSKYVRNQLEKAITASPKEVHRNYEIGVPIASLGPWTQIISSNILQEYFIPHEQVNTFLDRLRDLYDTYRINILNASVRYVPADTESVLSYAPHDCCSIVLYINVTWLPGMTSFLRKWTQACIDAAIGCGGTYYLPYHLLATQSQFQNAYPGWKRLREIKNSYDPQHIFSNTLIDMYIMQHDD